MGRCLAPADQLVEVGENLDVLIQPERIRVLED
jgi:hypothetical protein